jgi:hypothetical protein
MDTNQEERKAEMKALQEKMDAQKNGCLDSRQRAW